MDVNKEYYKSAMAMLELANTPLNGNKEMRVSVRKERDSFMYLNDRIIMTFLVGHGRDMAELILSFKLGVKVEKGDLREANKAKLLEVALE